MRFNRHFELKDKHAFLSASKSHWINYDPEKLISVFEKREMARRGTELHALAHEAIRLGVKFPNTHKTIDMYVNDCIGYRMENEVPLLVHDPLAFGTADAIDFGPNDDEDSPLKHKLRIFDLKTGETPSTMTQPKVYASYFCLEYNVRPMEIEYDLRIYQNDEIITEDVDPEEIVYIMSRTTESVKLITGSML